tara:strand:+ start:309 stop:548 length:240 start_codon:yes stop_codon:yes gene_type:complete
MIWNTDYDFPLKDNEAYIELYKLLKVINLVESGSIAKQVISDGMVLVDGKVEYKKRKKVRSGQVVEFNKKTIMIQGDFI